MSLYYYHQDILINLQRSTSRHLRLTPTMEYFGFIIIFLGFLFLIVKFTKMCTGGDGHEQEAADDSSSGIYIIEDDPSLDYTPELAPPSYVASNLEAPPPAYEPPPAYKELVTNH